MFLIDMFNKKTVMPAPEAALPGRAEPILLPEVLTPGVVLDAVRRKE